MKIAIETEGSTQKEFLLMQNQVNLKTFKNYTKIGINLNIAHSYFASKSYNLTLLTLLNQLRKNLQ